MRLPYEVFLIILGSSLAGCSETRSLKDGAVFEVGDYYGIHDDDGIAIYSKNFGSSVSLGPNTAAIIIGDQRIVAKHRGGHYEEHVVRRLNDEGMFDESGKGIVKFTD